MVSPTATYRVQFRPEFPFSSCASLAGYFRKLGISHIYASPILTARKGSSHGYDVVRYDEINPALGGAAGFEKMAAHLRDHGIGIILDIVPNHMAVGGDDNPLWLDVLRHGRSSRHADWFDIDFDTPDPILNGRLHAPFLGEPLPTALEGGQVRLSRLTTNNAGFAFTYGEHVFPVRPEDTAFVEEKGLAALNQPDQLAVLLARQHYVLDWWKNAGDRINWRRFFDITQLAAMRMDVPAAFAAAHDVALALYENGIVDGLRVDHVDGLRDPRQYCRQLRQELDARRARRPSGTEQERAGHERAWLLVEKILAPDEVIPKDWKVDGSTGYDFMDEVSALMHEPMAGLALSRNWAEVSGRARSFHDEEVAARREILDLSFHCQRERLIDAVQELAQEALQRNGVTRPAMRRALTQVLSRMRAYRGYAQNAADAPDARIDAAFEAALDSGTAERTALELIRAALGPGGGDRADLSLALARFNQLSAPLAAKAVEDTAFYRFGRLLSRNDVGFDASRLALDVNDFHGHMVRRAQTIPGSMLTTATHDHKRGEDVRARIAVLSQMPDTWIAASRRWQAIHGRLGADLPPPSEIHMFHQMLVGAWPLDLAADDMTGLGAFGQRLAAWWIKALREAKLRSSWNEPRPDIEDAVAAFVNHALDPAQSGAFLDEVSTFVDMIARPAAADGLVQKALCFLCPGVPDIYQGTELWDFSLVDPDNRRPVDFGARRDALDDDLPIERLLPAWRDGRVKLTMMRRLASLRSALPEVFRAGSYTPLHVTGQRKAHVVAFVRQQAGQHVIVVAARAAADGINAGSALCPVPGWWGDTHVSLPEGAPSVQPALSGGRLVGGRLPMEDALTGLPLAVWASPPSG
jgi:(1->4)-alpha-D-glucan 1-alpha-D-glucosylmutase